ncbi:hypothetical protein [Kitasatospora sp. NPDC059571]|uniref:hypothetical protein n=1 Tax=Kitasatospora sp. NPDC059571 TaxID=3346871 RepID=UPI0036BBE432
MVRLRTRAPLLGVLLLQAVLTVGLARSAQSAEAASLYGGHRLLDDLFADRPLDDNYDAYFPGLPYLYPVAAAWIDGGGGLAAARALSLACALAATWLVHATAARLGDERCAFFAAALFGLSAPALCSGDLATPDAPALLMLAAALFCAVRSADRESASTPAPVFAFLAVVLAYPAWLFVLPVAAAETALAAPLLGVRRALRRGALFLLWTAVPVTGVLFLTGWYDRSSILSGIAGALGRGGGQSAAEVAAWAVDCTGAVTLLGLLGAVRYARTADPVHGRPDATRTALAAVLAAGALLAPLAALWHRSAGSLETRGAFGLLFAALPAGLLLGRLTRHRTRSALLAVGLLATAAATAGWVSQELVAGHPDARALTAYLRPDADPPAAILAENAVLPRYYLYPDPVHAAVVSTSYMLPYTTAAGRRLTGPAAYRQAIEDRRFTRIVFDYRESPEQNRRLAALLAPNGYRLARTFPFHDTAYSAVPFDFPSTDGAFAVWERR